MSTVVQLLAEAVAATKAVKKTGRNQQQNYSFRGVEDIVKAAKPALSAVGLLVVPESVTSAYESVEVGAKRTPMLHCRMDVTYRVYGPEGDSIPVMVAAEAMDSGDKATAKAMSIAWRTALIQLLQIATGDAEPDAQSFERSGALTVREMHTVVKRAKNNREKLQDLYRQAERAGLLAEPVDNEDGDAESLGDLIIRWGKAAGEKRTAQRAAMPEPALGGGE